MDGLTGIVEMALVFGSVLVVLLWQLHSLKKPERDKTRKEENRE